jgi:hypothetical protein
MMPRTKREYLRELVADKNRWSRPLTGEERASGFPRPASRAPAHHTRAQITLR